MELAQDCPGLVFACNVAQILISVTRKLVSSCLVLQIPVSYLKMFPSTG
jgi:hypothetical protein